MKTLAKFSFSSVFIFWLFFSTTFACFRKYCITSFLPSNRSLNLLYLNIVLTKVITTGPCMDGWGKWPKKPATLRPNLYHRKNWLDYDLEKNYPENVDNEHTESIPEIPLWVSRINAKNSTSDKY